MRTMFSTIITRKQWTPQARNKQLFHQTNDIHILYIHEFLYHNNNHSILARTSFSLQLYYDQQPSLFEEQRGSVVESNKNVLFPLFCANLEVCCSFFCISQLVISKCLFKSQSLVQFSLSPYFSTNRHISLLMSLFLIIHSTANND